MKKLIAMLLALVCVFALAACSNDNSTPTTEPKSNVMSYEQYMAAAADSEVCIETYVQATRSWWNDTICVYAQGPDGGYFMYDMACSEADAAKLVPGTKIRVTGEKAIYDGEVEIMNATFEFVEGDTYVAEPMDATALLGTADLEKHMNKLASFTGLTIDAISYKNGEPGDDIYVTVALNGQKYDFCVEVYLTGTESDVYKTVGTLKAGDVVNVEGFLYWYNGVNTHITSIALAN